MKLFFDIQSIREYHYGYKTIMIKVTSKISNRKDNIAVINVQAIFTYIQLKITTKSHAKEILKYHFQITL